MSAAEMIAASVADKMRELAGRGVVREGSHITGFGGFKAVAVLRDSSARPKHRRRHRVAVRYDGGGTIDIFVHGKSWRQAKRQIAAMLRYYRGTVLIDVTLLPVQPVRYVRVEQYEVAP